MVTMAHQKLAGIESNDPYISLWFRYLARGGVV